MIPQYSVWLGGSMAILALLLAAIKLHAPASAWHRYGGRFSGLLGSVLLVVMLLRFFAYQVPLSWYSRGHVLVGLLAFLLLIGKFLAFRRILISPKYLRPLGFALTILFAGAGLGMVIPYSVQAFSWKPLQVEEVCRDPDQELFNRDCLSCHDRETAVDDLGKRPVPDWIKLVEPMAWAGAKPREDTRKALATLLATGVTPAPLPASGTISHAGDVLDRHCLSCHDRQRTINAGRKSPEKWQRLLVRMQKYSKEQPGQVPLADESLKQVLDFLTQTQGLENQTAVGSVGVVTTATASGSPQTR